MPPRSVIRAHPAHRDDIGDLVTRRPLPGPQIGQVDPFLFLNHHGPQTYAPNNRGLPFGPHPHRGFETVTFILEGDLAHLDSGGGESIIHAGGVQWMTAGSGLVHAEVSPEAFKKAGGPMEILQLWVNLPSRLKMTKPAYTGLQRADIPVVELPMTDPGTAQLQAGGHVAEGYSKVSAQVVSGTINGQEGPIRSLTGVELSIIHFEPGGYASLPAPKGRNVFFYVVRGGVVVRGATEHTAVEPWTLVEFADDGTTVEVGAIPNSVILYGHAQPIDEPVFSHGPFVMTTREEIIQAIEDYNAGKFGDVRL